VHDRFVQLVAGLSWKVHMKHTAFIEVYTSASLEVLSVQARASMCRKEEAVGIPNQIPSLWKENSHECRNDCVALHG
jgi:hypothetical protein